MAAAADPPQQQQQRPIRVRTITVFLQLPPVEDHWEAEIAAAGSFLATARQHLQSLGYEVQTTRIATQPFALWCGASSRGADPSSAAAAAAARQSALVASASRLEAAAARRNISLVSIGSCSDPCDLAAIPDIIAGTSSTSCSFALPPDAGLGLCQQVAAAIMRIAGKTGGMGNFRFAAASNMASGVPYFPVAVTGPQQHKTFALGTECDALLHEAFAAAAAKCSSSSSSSRPGQSDVLIEAAAQLQQQLLQHLQPLEQAALDVEATSAAAAAAQQQQQQQQEEQEVSCDGDPAACSQSQAAAASVSFRYLGIDTSLAPGLDTPALADSYELLGLGRFGGAGSLAVSGLITRVLKQLPLQLTGYCGLMLPVCEDTGLAAAAATGALTISQLLQYSAVCGCGLDTVPVPGPALATQAKPEGGGEDDQAAAAAQDARTTASIAGLLCDTNTLAYRLNKPLACRLLPLPGRAVGQPTDFSHPYMVNSRVMDLNR